MSSMSQSLLKVNSFQSKDFFFNFQRQSPKEGDQLSDRCKMATNSPILQVSSSWLLQPILILGLWGLRAQSQLTRVGRRTPGRCEPPNTHQLHIVINGQQRNRRSLTLKYKAGSLKALLQQEMLSFGLSYRPGLVFQAIGHLWGKEEILASTAISCCCQYH